MKIDQTSLLAVVLSMQNNTPSAASQQAPPSFSFAASGQQTSFLPNVGTSMPAAPVNNSNNNMGMLLLLTALLKDDDSKSKTKNSKTDKETTTASQDIPLGQPTAEALDTSRIAMVFDAETETTQNNFTVKTNAVIGGFYKGQNLVNYGTIQNSAINSDGSATKEELTDLKQFYQTVNTDHSSLTDKLHHWFMSRLVDNFSQIDTNKDDKISADEFKVLAAKSGNKDEIEESDFEIKNDLKYETYTPLSDDQMSLDVNNMQNASLFLSEKPRTMITTNQHSSNTEDLLDWWSKNVYEHFDQIDANSDGTATMAEYKALAAKSGESGLIEQSDFDALNQD